MANVRHPIRRRETLLCIGAGVRGYTGSLTVGVRRS